MKRGATTSAPSAIPAPHTAIRIPKPALAHVEVVGGEEHRRRGRRRHQQQRDEHDPDHGRELAVAGEEVDPLAHALARGVRVRRPLDAHRARHAASTRNVAPLATSANVVPPAAASSPPPPGPG